MRFDVAIVGGGPAGLAFSIEAARRGFSTVVLERQAFPCDKACGEGLMPAGVRALESLGARSRLDERDCSPFCGIRYVQEDGSFAQARFSNGVGLGIRRVALERALLERAAGVGVQLRERTAVRHHERELNGMRVETDGGVFSVALLVAADGLGSAIRRAEGLDGDPVRCRRYGLRQHFQVSPWSPFVEIHLCSEAEAYVTPAGKDRVGVALLWEDGRVRGPISFESLLGRFPSLRERLEGAKPESKALGAGPLHRKARSTIADRLVLLGDAAGYVDAITGEGLALSFECAAALGRLLPSALAQGASREALAPYAGDFARAFRRYSRVARLLLSIARRPRLRRTLVRALGSRPPLFDRLLAAATT